jgi:hypothetical protein
LAPALPDLLVVGQDKSMKVRGAILGVLLHLARTLNEAFQGNLAQVLCGLNDCMAYAARLARSCSAPWPKRRLRSAGRIARRGTARVPESGTAGL